MPFTSMLDKSKFLTSIRQPLDADACAAGDAGRELSAGRAHLRQSGDQEEALRHLDRRPHLAAARCGPIYGHDYHFHIRMNCPPGSAGCKAQAPVASGDGCDKSLAWWFTKEPWAPPKKDPERKAGQAATS